MNSLSLLSVLVVYPMTLFGDGCIVIAIALAATVGGRPLLWGFSFAAFHALYGVLGLILAGEVTTYSERLGDIFILIGSLILLRHFMHHSLHHNVGDDCSCENHKPVPASTRAIISTASAFSLHSLASGAIVRGIAGEVSVPLLVAIMVALSALVGTVIGAIVFIGDLERTPILRALDRLPGIVASLLTILCCLALYHLLGDLYPFGPSERGIFLIAALVLSTTAGYKVHKHRSKHMHMPELTRITTTKLAKR